MSLYLGTTPVTLGGTAGSGGGTTSSWARPSDWPALPTISSNNRLHGLVAIQPFENNFLAVNITVTGGYTVDWGDGTVDNWATGVTAMHSYTYSSLSSAVTSRGYKTAIVQIYPQTANAFTAVNLNVRHSSVAQQMETGWLDIAIQAPSMTSFNLGNSSVQVKLAMLEQIDVKSHAIATATNLFRGLSNLQSVKMTNPGNVIRDASNMFYDCKSLVSLPLFDTSGITNMSAMFGYCAALTGVPQFVTNSVTNMASMFYGCASLKTIPLLNTVNVTSMASMFQNCYALTSLPLLNTANVTSMASMFQNCYALPSVPDFNTANVTDFGHMFDTCWSLVKAPAFNTSKGVVFSYMFYTCMNLTIFPGYDTSSGTQFNYMLNGPASLVDCGTINLAKVSSGYQQTYPGPSTQRFIPLGIRYGLDLRNCNFSANAINGIFNALAGLGTKSVTATGDGTTMTYTTSVAHNFIVGQLISVTGMSVAGYNIADKVITSVTSTTFTVAGTATGAGTGGTANGGAGATISVSGNPGYAASDKTLATNKGWTVG